MRVPIAWLREYVNVPNDPQEIADRFASLGFPVEAIERRPEINGVVVGKITALEKHPNADRLQVGKIDIGSGNLLTIATAATNVAVGQVIPVARIGAQLPEIKIERRKMRGLESEGMMVSAFELALPAEWFEDGIMQLDPETPLGTDVVEFFGLRDAVLDVEVTGNRPDALSMLGLARELSAALGIPVRVPPLANPGTQADPTGEAPRVTIESSDCLRFVVQRFTGVRVGTAPAKIRIRLALAGQRPINNLVDISNYVMLETGQPLHFYDDANVSHHHLIVRDARPDEKLVTLDDAEHTLMPQALVIASEEGPQGLAGLKGGKISEVTPNTTAILLESANFNGARIRRMSAQLGFRTDASSRHEKTLAPALTDIGAARAAQLLIDVGATAYVPHAFGAEVEDWPAIRFPIREVPRTLGFTLPAEKIREYLAALGCEVSNDPTSTNEHIVLRVIPPLWRRDITIPVDLVEEVARIAGYENIPVELPTIAAHTVSSEAFDREMQLAHLAVNLGYHEIVSYALHGQAEFDRLKRVSVTFNRQAVEVRNPLSEDQRFLRHSLGPKLVEFFARVAKPIRAFEIGHIFRYDDDGNVDERHVLTLGFTAVPKNEPVWSDMHFLRFKGDVFEIIRAMTGQVPALVRDIRDGMHPNKTAGAFIDENEVASFGRIDPRATNVFDVSLPAYIGHIYIDRLPKYRVPRYVAPSKYPSTYRDLSLTVNFDITAAQIEQTIQLAIGASCTNVRVFDEYRGPQVGEGKKSLTVRVTLLRADATITDQDADAAIAKILNALQTTLGAVIRT